MIHHDRRARALAIALAALAGFVDALGFLALGGFFVSFMSGNSTRLAVGLVGDRTAAGLSAALIGAFVLGVAAGSLVGHAGGGKRRSTILAFVASLLAAAAALDAFGAQAIAIYATAFAMGAENAVFERDGEVSIGVTYMTGTLVKFGQHLAGLLLGRDRLAWVPYFLLWLGLAGGAVLGALLYPLLHLGGLWIAAAAALGLARLAPLAQ